MIMKLKKQRPGPKGAAETVKKNVHVFSDLFDMSLLSMPYSPFHGDLSFFIWYFVPYRYINRTHKFRDSYAKCKYILFTN
jgi:hypothetical protein